MSNQALNVSSQDIDHLGIVAGIIDEIGLESEINHLVGTHPLEVVSAGQAVKAMILNGLGFVSAPLYLFEQFFLGKATEMLIGEAIHAEHLNDSRLGRVLDDLYQADVSEVFVRVALKAFHRYKVNSTVTHLDSTSFHVHGEYSEPLGGQSQPEVEPASEGLDEPLTEPRPIQLVHGYSRDHRPDLKQFIVQLICSGDGGVPCYLKVADGNEADQAVFAQRLQAFREQWTMDVEVYVADAALYSEENIQAMGELGWISRVPASLKQAQQLLQQTAISELQPIGEAGYRYAVVERDYGGVAQRWFVIESQARQAADLKQLDAQVQRQHKSHMKALKALAKEEFACEADARARAQQFNSQLKLHQLTDIRIIEQKKYAKTGRPTKESTPTAITYCLNASLVENPTAIEVQRTQAGRFILATNLLDAQQLSAQKVLRYYKDQQYSERGFRFLKDPLFFASSVFLKSPKRIMALALIMALSLLVYALAERQLRQVLHEQEQTVLNQLRKPTKTPTLRWIFQCFQAIHVIWIDGVKRISNLTDERRRVLHFFGSACEKYYLLC